MNPYKLKDVFKYLTSNNQLLKKKLKLGTSEIPIPPKRQDVIDVEVINRFTKANPRVDTTNLKPLSVKQSKEPDMKAEGGRAGYEDGGMLVQPSDDGSRPGYKDKKKGNPGFNTEEFYKKRDMGKDIPKVRNYLDKILKKKDSIIFDTIADIKKKAGLAETSKVDADISRLLTNEYKDTVKTKGQLAKVGNAEKFRNILRDIQETIPKGKKQFINIAFTATKNKLSGSPNSGAYSRILQEPEFKNFVVLTKDVQSNPQIIRFAEEFEKLYEIQDIDREFFGELAENIYGNKSKDSLRKISGDASKYAEFLYGVRDVTDADGRKLKLPNVEKRGDYLFELIDETLGLEEGEKGKVRPLKFGSGFERDRMFAIRDGLLGLKEGETDSQRRNIKKLLKKGYNLDEVAGLSATHEIAPGYTELVQGLKKKVNADKMSKIDKPFSRIFEQVVTGQKPIKGFQYGDKFYQDINEVVKLYNKDATAYGKKYSIDTPLIEYDPRPGKKINPKNFLPNFKYLSPAAQANVKELADKGIGVRTDALTMNQIQDAADPNLKTERTILKKIQGYSKLPQCKVGAADGGRIGFAYSDECVRDGLKEQKIEAQKGNKKAAQELVQVGKVATRAGLLRNLLGPGAILGEAVYEGVVIGNKILEGTPKDIAWAESYLSYLDPRKYTPKGLDPLEMRREDMITREDFSDPDYAEDPYTLEMVKQGESKTIDGPNANILRSGFAAQDQVSAFNEAVNEKLRGESANRFDIANRAAADVREQGRFVDQSKDIISSDAFQEASKQAQEYIQSQTGENMFPYNQLKQSIGKYESGEARDLRGEREKEMQALGGTYLDYKNPFTKDEYENFARQEGYLPIDKSYTDKYFTEAILNPLKFEQLMETPGFKGASNNFASGGIASLTKTIPPESGPTPQGLPYVYNNVKKI